MPIDAKAADILSRGWYKEKLEPHECEYLLTFLEHVVNGNQHRMGNSYRSTVGTSSDDKPLVLCGKK